MKRRKIFIAILAFIVIESISYTSNRYLDKLETENYLAEKTSELKIGQHSVCDAYTGMINLIFEQNISKPEVLKLYSQALTADSIQRIEIRDSLHKLLLPLYDQLKLINVRQFIFIMPDNKVFLRFHRLNKYEDDLTEARYSIKTANETKQKQTGFEEGKTYDGFRSIFPINYENKHIGVVEISFSIAAYDLLEHDGMILGFMLKKDIVDQKVSSNLKDSYIQSLLSDNYKHEKTFLHYHPDSLNTIERIDRNIKQEIAERLDKNESFTIHHLIDNAHYLISFLSIKNVEGIPVAYMISYQKDKKVIIESLQQYILKQIATFFLLAMLIFVILLITIKKGELKEIDAQYKSIIDANNDIVFIVDELGNQLYFNKQMKRFLGYDYQELNGKSFKEFIPKNEIPKYLEKLEEVFINKHISPFETLVTHKNGNIIPVEIAERVIKYNGENVSVGTIRDITDRKKAEQEIKKLSTAMEQSSNTVVITSTEGKIEYTNPKFSEITGYTAEEALGQNPRILNAGSQPKEYYAELWKTIRSGETWKGEFHNKKKNGDYFWEQVIITPIKDESGKIVNYLAIKEDFTARRKAEQEVRKLSTAVEQSANTIVITDTEGKIEYTNPKFSEITGYTAEEAIGQNPSILNAGTQTKEYYADLWKTISSGKTWKGEFHNKKKNGEYFWEHLTITPIKDESDTIVNYLAIKEDFTARRKAEQALITSEKKQKKILDSFVDGIYITTNTFEISYVNASLQSKLGYNPIGKKCYNVLHNLDDKCKWCIFGKLQKEESLEYELQKEDKVFLVNNILLGDGNKLTVLKDISDRNKAEKDLKLSELKLKESNDAKDKFFSIIAHDLKSPFNSLLGFSEILDKNFDDFDIEKQKRFTHNIHKGILNTYNLLENLLTWSRSQRGFIDFKPERLNLYLLFNETIELLYQSVERKSIKLEAQIDESIDVYADKEMLLTIIRNLLSNAIKFTLKDGAISIFVQSKNEGNKKYVELAIADNGIGISEEIQNKLFDISESTSTLGTADEKGTGLGLIICKEFVEKHKGKLWVESKIGKGSKFIFTLPVQ